MKKRISAFLLCLLFFACTVSAALATGDAAPPEPPAGDMGAPPEGTPPGGGGMFGGSGTVTQGDAATIIDSSTTVQGEAYVSASENENALRITGEVDVTLQEITVTKAGDTANTEDSDFYGQNAALLATDGAQVSIERATISSDGSGGNAVFSYGEGTHIDISDSMIRTSLNNSGGVHVAGGGSLTATDLDVETQGSSAAAVRSDRGGGNLDISGGAYTTNGTGSPAIYSTATITASGATFNARNAEAIVVEGKHSVALVDCDVTGNMDSAFLADIKDTPHNIMIYQSMSGDADQGQSSFSMQGGTLTATTGEMFYITNTDCTIDLSGVSLTLADDVLLRIAGNNASRGWGTAGSNGGQCTFTADAQTLSGQILADDISTLRLALTGGSAYSGAINPGGQAGEVDVTLDSGSTWALTADSYISSLEGDLGSITAGEYHLYVAGERVL